MLTGGEVRDGCCICAATGDLWVRMVGSEGKFVGPIGGFNHESEHDLALMVSVFLENGSGGADSRYNSDNESGLSDLAHLADKILGYRKNPNQMQGSYGIITTSTTAAPGVQLEVASACTTETLLDNKSTKGNIVVCTMERWDDSFDLKLNTVKKSGGAGMILFNQLGKTVIFSSNILPSIKIGSDEAQELQAYLFGRESNCIYISDSTKS